MKKHLLGWVAMAGMLFVTSCAKDVDVVAADSSEATVTFNVGLESALSTRATISDGSEVNALYVAAFNEQGEPVGTTENFEIKDKSADVTLTLVKGEKYTVAFWAQSDDAYDVTAFPTVAISYVGAKNNDEKRDAFFAVKEVTVSDNIEKQDVTLKRPFAQINLAVLDENASKVTKSSMTVKGGLATSFNVLEGKAVGNEDNVTFAADDVPEGELKEGYEWLSMSYVLFAGDVLAQEPTKATLNIEFTFNEDPQNTVSVSNIPVEYNKRTNLLANNNTTDVDFDVDVDGAFGDTDEDIENVPWDDDEEAAVITVSKFTVTTTETEVSFEAEYTYEGEGVVTAQFVCTPDAAGAALTRAEGGVVTVNGEVSEGKITAKEDIGSFTPGVKYNVTLEVSVDGATAKVETSGEAETQTPELTIPDEQGGEEPEAGTFISDDIFVTSITGDAHEVMKDGSTVNGETATGVKIGNSSKGGLFTTAAVGITGNYTLTLYGAAWTTETAPIYVRVNNGGSVISGDNGSTMEGGHNVTSTNATYTITDITDANKYTFNLSGLTENSTITISTNANFENASPKARAAVFGIKLTKSDTSSVEPEPEPEEPAEEVKAVSVSDFLAAEVSTTQVYELTGTVSNIINTQYGNFDLTDETGTVYVYGISSTPQVSGSTADKTFSSMNIAAGDKIKVQGYRADYQGTAQVGSAWLIEIVEQAPKEEQPTPTDELVYTLAPEKGTNSDYSKNCDITVGDIVWNLSGNSQMVPWRIGGKNLETATDRTLYSKTVVNQNISMIQVEHGAASNITVNSFKVIVSKNDDFSSPVFDQEIPFEANKTATIERPASDDWSECYYKFVYNVTVTGGTNRFIEFTGAKFYGK